MIEDRTRRRRRQRPRRWTPLPRPGTVGAREDSRARSPSTGCQDERPVRWFSAASRVPVPARRPSPCPWSQRRVEAPVVGQARCHQPVTSPIRAACRGIESVLRKDASPSWRWACPDRWRVEQEAGSGSGDSEHSSSALRNATASSGPATKSGLGGRVEKRMAFERFLRPGRVDPVSASSPTQRARVTPQASSRASATLSWMCARRVEPMPRIERVLTRHGRSCTGRGVVDLETNDDVAARRGRSTSCRPAPGGSSKTSRSKS